MKKLFVLLLSALALSTGAFAQNTDTGWFVGSGVGMNVGFTGKKFVGRLESNIGAGLNIGVNAGYWFSKIYGVRAGYQGVNTSSTFTSFGSKNYTYIHGDALFRVSPFMIPYAHVGLVGVERLTVGGGIGLALPIELSPRVSLVPDLRILVFGRNGYIGEPGVSFAMTPSLCVMVRLGNL